MESAPTETKETEPVKGLDEGSSSDEEEEEEGEEKELPPIEVKDTDKFHLVVSATEDAMATWVCIPEATWSDKVGPLFSDMAKQYEEAQGPKRRRLDSETRKRREKAMAKLCGLVETITQRLPPEYRHSYNYMNTNDLRPWIHSLHESIQCRVVGFHVLPCAANI
jgi:hypothetical protein